jgi:hypothetical protein
MYSARSVDCTCIASIGLSALLQCAWGRTSLHAADVLKEFGEKPMCEIYGAEHLLRLFGTPRYRTVQCVPNRIVESAVVPLRSRIYRAECLPAPACIYCTASRTRPACVPPLRLRASVRGSPRHAPPRVKSRYVPTIAVREQRGRLTLLTVHAHTARLMPRPLDCGERLPVPRLGLKLSFLLSHSTPRVRHGTPQCPRVPIVTYPHGERTSLFRVGAVKLPFLISHTSVDSAQAQVLQQKLSDLIRSGAAPARPRMG